MAPKRKRAPKKESSSKKQKSVVVKQNVRQNANPTIHINLAPSRQKSRAKQRSPVLQSRQQQQQPNPSQINVAPVINISLADVLSNQRTPGIQPSSSQISTARTATGGNVYRSALFREQPMPTRQNLTEKIIQTDELNVKDAPGLEIPSNVSVQPGDNSNHLQKKTYTSNNMEEEDFDNNTFEDLISEPQDFSDDEYEDAMGVSMQTEEDVRRDINKAIAKKNENELQNVKSGQKLSKDELFDGGDSMQTDGTEKNVTDVTVTTQTTANQALQTLKNIIQKTFDYGKMPPMAVVNFLKEKENRDKIIMLLRETNNFGFDVIKEGFDLFDKIIGRTKESVGVVADLGEEIAGSTGQVGKKIINTGINLTRDAVQGGFSLVDTAVKNAGKVVNTATEEVGNVANTATEQVGKVANTATNVVGKVANTATQQVGNVATTTTEQVGNVATTVARGVGEVANVTAIQGTRLLGNAAIGMRDAGPLALQAVSANLQTAIKELTDTGIVTVQNIDDFIERARITPRVRSTALIMKTLANDSGEFLISRLNVLQRDLKDTLDAILEYGLDVGVRASAATGMAIYNIKTGLTLPVGPVGSDSSSASLTPASPENEIIQPFTFDTPIAPGNTNQSLVPMRQQQPLPQLTAQPLPQLTAPPQEKEPQFNQQTTEENQNTLNLTDVIKLLIGNPHSTTRSDADVLVPVFFPDSVSANDNYHRNLLEAYRLYKTNDSFKQNQNFFKNITPAKLQELWDRVKSDQKYLSTLGIAPVLSFGNDHDFKWDEKGIKQRLEELKNQRADAKEKEAISSTYFQKFMSNFWND
jgi:hypothetical protein